MATRSRRTAHHAGTLPQGKRSLWQQVVRSRYSYISLLPLFLLLLIFVYYPPISALYHAFYDWNPAGRSTFVGLDNFRQMGSDSILKDSVGNLLKLTAFGIAVGVTVPLFFAELIFAVKNESVRYAYRVLILLPVVAPGVVTLLLWKFIYDANFGLLNGLLGAVGLSGLERDWLGDPTTALPAIMFLGFPFLAGTSVLIYLAGLMSIPNEVMEAAQLDGATGWRRIRHIDLPLLTGQIKLFLVLSIIGNVQRFGDIYILTQGGPGFSTNVPGLVMYEDAFASNEFGYAAAIGLVMFLVILVFTVIVMRFMRSSTEFEGR